MSNIAQYAEAMAKRILEAAIREGRSWELLECLFQGGSATVDARTGELVLVDAEALDAMTADQGP